MSKGYWKAQKSFIKPTQTSVIPSLYQNEVYIPDNTEKSYVLNNYYTQQTLLDDSSSTLPVSINIVGPSVYKGQSTFLNFRIYLSLFLCSITNLLTRVSFMLRTIFNWFVRNPGRDISFPILTRKEIETKIETERKSKQ